MTGDASLFLKLNYQREGNVTFADNTKGRIIGKGTIDKNPGITIENVWLLEGLMHNLLSISQLCDSGYQVQFYPTHCTVQLEQKMIFIATRLGNTYSISLNSLTSQDVKCLVVFEDESWKWHRRLGHVNMKLISHITRKDLVKGVPILDFSKDKVCDACQRGKQVRTSFKPINEITTSRPLELLHTDLFGTS